jgi:hypothetical protein
MNHAEPEKESISLSIEKIVDLIRTLRNDLAKDFLKDEVLTNYYRDNFHKELTLVKKEFIKRELKELLISPVDLAYYAGLINHLRETQAVAEKNDPYFYADIDRIIAKYKY